MLKKIRLVLSGDDSGTTLIELIIGIALAAAILFVAGTMVYQLFAVPQAAGNHLQAILAVDNVGDWLIRDGQQAEAADVDISSVAVTGGTRKLRLFCQFSAETHMIDYVVLSSNRLRRDDYLNASPTATSAVIGENITNFSVTGAADKYQVAVGATVSGIVNQSTQLTYTFKPRF